MSDKLREAAQAALEMLKDYHDYRDCAFAVGILKAALAEPAIKESLTAQRPWVGLKYADFKKEKFVDYNFMLGASFAEAKLKEKNGG